MTVTTVPRKVSSSGEPEDYGPNEGLLRGQWQAPAKKAGCAGGWQAESGPLLHSYTGESQGRERQGDSVGREEQLSCKDLQPHLEVT